MSIEPDVAFIVFLLVLLHSQDIKSISIPMKCFRDFAKNFVLRSDLFAAQPTLRIAGQSSYQTLFGGCFSILLVIAFAVIFGASFLNVLQKIDITSSMIYKEDVLSEEAVENIKFAVGIQGIDLREPKQYFSIFLEEHTITIGGSPVIKDIPMTACSKTVWEKESQDVGQHFDAYGMEKFLCPEEGVDLSISGFAGSKVEKKLMIRVEQCAGGSASCYTSAEISTYVTTQSQNHDFLRVKFYMVDTVISPESEVYLHKVIQSDIFLSFSSNSGARGIIKLSNYQVNTDGSIWPVVDLSTETGHYISSHSLRSIELLSTHYVKVELQRSSKVYTVNRNHEKLDNMLSYVGGLFALLFGWISFFFASYNEYKYEIAVGESSFKPDDKEQKVGEKQFGFFAYLQYSIYDWITTLGLRIKWKKMEQIHEFREEATEQIDIRLMMKKLQKFERLFEMLVGEDKYVCSQLMSPPSLKKVKAMRKISQYYEKVMKGSQGQPRDLPVQNGVQVNDSSIHQPEINSNLQANADSQPETDSDFDSEDEQAQIKIVESFNVMTSEVVREQNELAHKISEAISIDMKTRLSRIGAVDKPDKQLESKMQIIYEEEDENKPSNVFGHMGSIRYPK